MTTSTIEFGDAARAGIRVLVIHGWGMHAEPYTPLCVHLAARGAHVVAFTLPGHGAIASTTQFTRRTAEDAVRGAFAALQAQEPRRPVAVVAESAGAAFALASLVAHEPDCWALLAPAMLPRLGQLFSPRALVDGWRLLVRNELPLLGWRLESGSSNAEFLKQRRTDGLTLAFQTRSYVWTVVTTVIKAFFLAGRVHHPVRIWQGSGDRVLNPLGARLLHGRLGAVRNELTLIGGADHGLIWDPRAGERVMREVADWVSQFREPD